MFKVKYVYFTHKNEKIKTCLDNMVYFNVIYVLFCITLIYW